MQLVLCDFCDPHINVEVRRIVPEVALVSVQIVHFKLVRPAAFIQNCSALRTIEELLRFLYDDVSSLPCHVDP